MIALVLALQVAAAPGSAPIPTFVVVRDGTAETSVPVTINGGEASVRADVLVKAMRGMLITGTNLHYTLVLPRVRLDLIDGIPFAKRDSLTIPLTRAPQVRGGQLYLPFQFVSEVIPRHGGGYYYDVARGVLGTFATVAERPPPARTVTTTQSKGSPLPPPRTASSTTPSTGSVPPPARPKPASRKMVVIDAGHGGPDNGMTGPIGTPAWFV